MHFGAAFAGRDAITHIHLQGEIAQALINKNEEKTKLETEIKELRESIEQQRSLQERLEKGSRAYQRAEESLNVLTADIQQYMEELEQVNQELVLMQNTQQGRSVGILKDVKILAKEQGKATGAEIEGHLDQVKIIKGSTTAESGGNATGLRSESLRSAIVSEHIVSATGENSTAVGLKVDGSSFSTTPFSDNSPAPVSDGTAQSFIKELHFAKNRIEDFNWDHLLEEYFGRSGFELINEFVLRQAGGRYDVILRNPRKDVSELQNNLRNLLQDKKIVYFNQFINMALKSLVKKKRYLKDDLDQIKNSDSLQILKDQIDSLRQKIGQLKCLQMGDSSIVMNNNISVARGAHVRGSSTSDRDDWIRLPGGDMTRGTSIAAAFTSRPTDWQKLLFFDKKPVVLEQSKNTIETATASTVNRASPWRTNLRASNLSDSGFEEYQPGESTATKK